MSDLKTLIERYVDCYNAMDIDGMLDCVDETIVFENVSNAGNSMRLQGKEALREIAGLGAQAFTYRRQNVVQLICDEAARSAAAEVQFRGIAALDLPNGTKKGESVELRGVSVFECDGTLLTRIADFS